MSETPTVLQRLVVRFGGSNVDVETLIRPDPTIVRVIDPTEQASEIARHKDELRCNTLAAEVIAGARQEATEVWLVPANAAGQLWVAVAAADQNSRGNADDVPENRQNRGAGKISWPVPL